MGFFADIAGGLGQSTLNRQQTELLRFLEEERFKREQEAQIAAEQRSSQRQIASEERQAVRESERDKEAEERQRESMALTMGLNLRESDPSAFLEMVRNPDSPIRSAIAGSGVNPDVLAKSAEAEQKFSSYIGEVQNVFSKISSGQPYSDEEISTLENKLNTIRPADRGAAEVQLAKLYEAKGIRLTNDLKRLGEAIPPGSNLGPNELEDLITPFRTGPSPVSDEAVRIIRTQVAASRISAQNNALFNQRLRDDAEIPKLKLEERQNFISDPRLEVSYLKYHTDPDEIMDLQNERKRLWTRIDPKLESEIGQMWTVAERDVLSLVKGAAVATIPEGAGANWEEVVQLYSEGNRDLAQELFKRDAFFRFAKQDFVTMVEEFSYIPESIVTEKSGGTRTFRAINWLNARYDLPEKFQELENLARHGLFETGALSGGPAEDYFENKRIEKIEKRIQELRTTLEGARSNYMDAAVMVSIAPENVYQTIDYYLANLEALRSSVINQDYVPIQPLITE